LLIRRKYYYALALKRKGRGGRKKKKGKEGNFLQFCLLAKKRDISRIDQKGRGGGKKSARAAA